LPISIRKDRHNPDTKMRWAVLAATGATVGSWAIPTPCPARWAGMATGMRMLPATASSAGPAPISGGLTVSGISANRSPALRLNQTAPKGRLNLAGE
jgi:hypothetical protein